MWSIVHTQLKQLLGGMLNYVGGASPMEQFFAVSPPPPPSHERPQAWWGRAIGSLPARTGHSKTPLSFSELLFRKPTENPHRVKSAPPTLGQLPADFF